MGIITGSEGLLGVITEITVRILQKPETARALMVGFAQVEAAGQCVAEIIGAGIIPGGMEMMDKPAIHAAEAFVHAGYPLDVEALLIIELDGPGVEVDELIKRVEAIAQSCGSTSCQISNFGGRAQSVLGRPQGGVSGGGADFAGLSLHGRHHSARRAAEGAWRGSATSRPNTICASPTCFMPATAICIP